MFGSVLLDTLIGLMAVYLTLALAVTAVNEFIAQFLSMRSVMLKKAIQNLLVPETVEGTPSKDDQETLRKFLSHPLIAALAPSGKFPSYLEAQTFARTVVQILSGDGKPVTKAVEELQGTLRYTLSALGADGKMLVSDELEKHLTVWFNGAMERVSGWYKRRLQLISLVIAAFLVVLVNADTVAIFRELTVNRAAREQMVSVAEQYLAEDEGGTGETVPAKRSSDQIKADLVRIQESGLPLGWSGRTEGSQDLVASPRDYPKSFHSITSKVIGLLISIFAVSLGAPFWFDLLSRFMQVRSSGKKPEDKKP